MEDTTDSLLRIEAIFNEALAVPSEARKVLIETRSNGDRELIAEVCALLKACEVAENLTASSQPQTEPAAENSADPQRVGNYLLDRLLGRGGMGAVYLAHRADGEFEQKVAIKLIDLPLATEIFRQRFRQERQILAGLQHPYIARLLDGGVTVGGDPYLVMEYVDGVPIHRYCENHALSVADRIALFLRVCEAVQFAHQNFVVHRDLKPDNILVAEDGTPRLLDFGTAKLLSPSMDKPGGDLTREGYQSYTPQYASPEQVLGNPITTASDTYSLGILLYLLLTSTQPYELKEPTMAEMLRVVCKEAPRRPASADGQRLDADLEAILLKALRKEPRERYLTAEQFSADLRAYLEGLPVAARRGNLRYRAAKFIRRNRIAVGASALLAASLIAGVIGVAWQSKVANDERRKAEASAEDMRQLSNSLLSELNEAIQQIPGSTGAQKLLVTRVLEHLDRAAHDSRSNRQTRIDLADAYARLGNIQGNTYVQNLGDFNGALASMDKAIALVEPLTANGSTDSEALRVFALAQESRSEILFGTTRMSEAVASMKLAIAAYERILALPGVTPVQLCDAASAYGILGDELGNAGSESLYELPAALSAFQKDRDLVNRALSLDPNLIRTQRTLIIVQMKIGEVESEIDPAQALKDYRLGLQSADALPKNEQQSLRMNRVRSSLLEDEAGVLIDLGEYAAGNAIYANEALDKQKLAAADPLDLRAQSDWQTALDREASGYEVAAEPELSANAADRRRNLATAEGLRTQEVDILQNLLKRDPSNDEYRPVLAGAQIWLGTIRYILHASKDSPALVKSGLAAMRELAKKDPDSPATLDSVASTFLMVEPASFKDPLFSVSCAERAVTLTHRKLPSMLLTLAQAYRAAGQIDKSRSAAQEGLALLPASQPGSTKPRLRKLLENQTAR
jgi:serine/threonine protein kinase